jgi:hypothetical protein
MKSFTAYLLGTFLLLSAASAADIWTSIGATGTILPVGTAAAQVSPPKVSYSTTSTLTGTFQIVYNVTSDSTAFPSWTTVEVVGSNDNTNNGLYVNLYASSRTTGAVTPLITASAGPIPGTTVITGTTTPGYVFDFTNYNYYIVVDLARSSTTAHPSVSGVRVY